MIGILAGMGPYSTAPFLNLVLKECEHQYGAKDDIDFPKMLIYSLPTPFYPDKPVDHTAMMTSLQEGLTELENTSVDFMAIACNTAHAYYSNLKTNKPLLNLVDIAVSEIPVHIKKVAVISSRVTLDSQVYENKLKQSFKEIILPQWQEDIDSLILLLRSDESTVAEKCSSLIAMAKNAGAEAILLACFDLSVVSKNFTSDIPVYDASQLLAQKLITNYLETCKRKEN